MRPPARSRIRSRGADSRGGPTARTPMLVVLIDTLIARSSQMRCCAVIPAGRSSICGDSPRHFSYPVCPSAGDSAMMVAPFVMNADLASDERSRPGAYAIAIAMFAIAVVVLGLLDSKLKYDFPYVAFFPAVIISASYGGFGPGLITASLSAISAEFLSFAPPFTVGIRSPTDSIAVLLFFGVSIFICLLCERLRRATVLVVRHKASFEAARLELADAVEKRSSIEKKEADGKRWAQDTLSSIGDGVICTDIDGQVTFINSVAENLTGWEAAHAIGQPMMRVFHIINETTRELAVNPIGRVLTEGLVLGLANHTVLISKSKREVPIDDSGAPIRNSKREIVGAVLVFRDISDRKAAEETLQRTVTRLTRSNEDLAAFAHALSHDLQEPVRTIGTISELLVHQYGERLDKDAHEHLKFIIDGAARLTQMIRSLLSYARMVNAQEGTMSSVRLADAVNWAEANLHQLVSVVGAKIECADMPTVSANEVQMVQVFQNLLENAIKYRSAARPHICIESIESEQAWEIIVRDNGIGIAALDQKDIFKLFKRGPAPSPGSGIGLAVCKRIIERHGGRIWVESAIAEGSAFHFTLSKRPEE